jgi:IMP cyclohydrolase
MKINEILNRPYPGRGIVMGLTPDSKNAVIAYFIMGRSDNSRNRIFVAEGENLRTQAFDESLVTDPSLIIYNPVKVKNDKIVVTNGAQTETFLNNTSYDALNLIEYEPDPPFYTPRISAVMNLNNFDYEMSIAKSANGNPDSCRRFLYGYSNPIAGQGHFIHTYDDDPVNLASFSGEPHTVEIDSVNIDEFTDTIWASLNTDNKVSLFTRFINLESKTSESKIVNKLEN